MATRRRTHAQHPHEAPPDRDAHLGHETPPERDVRQAQGALAGLRTVGWSMLFNIL
jgi:hypothetical protein